MTILHRMHNPYVDVKSLCLCACVYIFQWIDTHILFIHLGNIDVKLLVGILGIVTTFFAAVYNIIKTYLEVSKIITKYRRKKKEQRAAKKFNPPDDDQFD